MLVRADGAQLAEIARLIDAGTLHAFVEQTFPLANAREAYDCSQKGGIRGKIALRVAKEAVINQQQNQTRKDKL